MLPNLIVIGAGKCGTSSLYYYLGQHPEITMSQEKELLFFSSAPRWQRGVEWYERCFDGASTPVCGEASPQYTSYPFNQGVPERMHSVVPGAKLIYLVGDPIERMVSAYVERYAERLEERPFAEAVTPPHTSHYVLESSYHMQLEQYLRHYPAEQILVLSREELLRGRRATLGKVFRFLGVDPSFDTPEFDRIKNRSRDLRRIQGPRWLPGRRVLPRPTGRLPWGVRARARRILYSPVSRGVEPPTIDAPLRDALVEHLKPDADRLRRLTGMSFSEWSL
jgi:hypothetical protein